MKVDWSEVSRYYDLGHSVRECKEQFGFSNSAWDKAAIEGRVSPRENPQKRWKHNTRSAVEKLRTEGLNQAEIAQELGLSKPTVSYHLRKLGVPRDGKAARRFDWIEIQRAHDSGLSSRECCTKFGCSRSAWSEAVRSGRIKARSHLIPLADLLRADRRVSRGHLRSRLVKEGLKVERCEECGLEDWRGEPMRVTLHHVNGDSYDNRLENLRFLCPNCHSQTPNFSGRNGHLRARPEV